MKKLLVGLCFLIAVQAQTTTVAVDIFSKVGTINRLSLNDLNLTSKDVKVAPDIFGATINIQNATGKGYSAVFTIEIRRNSETLFEIKSKPILNIVDANDSWTSSDLGATLSYPKNGGQKLSFKSKAVGSFSASAASLPDGNYTVKFTVEVFSGNNKIAFDDDEETIADIVNNFAITLNSPSDDGEIINGTPTFTWSSGADLSKLKGLKIFIYEINGSEPQSASIARKPILEEEVNKSSTSFTFPSNNTRSLQAGKSYYWTLKSKIEVLAGESSKVTEIPADNINRFTFTAAGTSTFTEMQIDGLEEIMGQQYSKVMASLNGYRLKSAKFMGQPVTSGTGSKIIDFFTTAMKKAGAKVIINY